ncbi:glycosyltransferase family A protein [Nocardioides sp. YIM 152315]|uniref:glycosyltransferase family A protein n=1 Tax=Nocardioides sp. YIM 152315 TaxID=3031760 RepID=UPI0023DC4C68|nr:glycosyltransferase family A protein [Nocardioides sp. YIM 152315]MDF1604955.1 glycosyltransferase family A protein [Nocardioides sp. YIM 152315]
MADPALSKLLDGASEPVVVLHDPGVELRGLPAGVTLSTTGHDLPGLPHRWGLVVLACTDVLSLRRWASVLPGLGRTRVVACLLVEAERPVTLVPRPEWPMLTALNARRVASGATLTVARFESGVRAELVLRELARTAAPGRAAYAGLVAATTRPDPATAPPVDPGLQVLARPADAVDEGRTIPPDVVLGSTQTLPAHHVIDRPPTTSTDARLLRAPVDEAVLNPAGYLKDAELSTAALEAAPDGRLLLRGDGLDHSLSAEQGATPTAVRLLRPHRGVRVSWPPAEPERLVRTVAGLAAAGVPLVADDVPATARAGLGDRLADLLLARPDLGSSLPRDEHSVRLRRAGLLEHSALAWRRRLAAAAGLPFRPFPSVTAVLATKRPHLLGHALRQVAKQRGADVEVVVAAHGFDADPDLVRAHVGDRFVLRTFDESTFFGDVLNGGVDAASGDLVLKIDDDDWYGPDFVADLLLARHYSGAEVVGTTVEYAYLAPINRTIRRRDDSERIAQFVAGGSIMTDRASLTAAGRFRRVRRYVDAQLLDAARQQGQSIYRSHGLGYMLRRTAAGHTWDPGLEYYLSEERLEESWDGFHPSALLEHDESEVPDEARSP